MPQLNIKISERLMKEIRVGCAESGKTQPEFVSEILEVGFGMRVVGKPVGRVVVEDRAEPEKPTSGLATESVDKSEGVGNGDGVRVRSEVGERGAGRGSKAVRRASSAGRSQDKSGAVVGGGKADRSGEGKGGEGREVTALDLTGERPVHNVKTCRVYRCDQCVAAGKKF